MFVSHKKSHLKHMVTYDFINIITQIFYSRKILGIGLLLSCDLVTAHRFFNFSANSKLLNTLKHTMKTTHFLAAKIKVTLGNALNKPFSRVNTQVSKISCKLILMRKRNFSSYPENNQQANRNR